MAHAVVGKSDLTCIMRVMMRSGIRGVNETDDLGLLEMPTVVR